MKKTKGAFGGYYNHSVIKELKAELAKMGLIMAALIDHTDISEAQLKDITQSYVLKRQDELSKEKNRQISS